MKGLAFAYDPDGYFGKFKYNEHFIMDFVYYMSKQAEPPQLTDNTMSFSRDCETKRTK